MQYNSVQYITAKYNTVQYNTIQYITKHNTIHIILYNTIQYDKIQYNTLQYTSLQYSAIQYNTIQNNTIQYNLSLIHVSFYRHTWPSSKSTKYSSSVNMRSISPPFPSKVRSSKSSFTKLDIVNRIKEEFKNRPASRTSFSTAFR